MRTRERSFFPFYLLTNCCGGQHQQGENCCLTEKNAYLRTCQILLLQRWHFLAQGILHLASTENTAVPLIQSHHPLIKQMQLPGRVFCSVHLRWQCASLLLLVSVSEEWTQPGNRVGTRRMCSMLFHLAGYRVGKGMVL